MADVHSSVTVIKPFKLIAVILLIIGLILLIVSIASPDWLETKGYKQGLWRECMWGNEESEKCTTLDGEDWVKACGALCIIALMCTFVATIMTIIGLCNHAESTKKWMYKISMVITLFAVICMVIALIVFPVKFIDVIHQRKYGKWLFQWAYGIGWGATIFFIGATVMLYLNKESYVREYNNNKYSSEA